MDGKTLPSLPEAWEGSKAFISFSIWQISLSMPITLGWRFQFLGEEGREETQRIIKCDLFWKGAVFQSCHWKILTEDTFGESWFKKNPNNRNA